MKSINKIIFFFVFLTGLIPGVIGNAVAQTPSRDLKLKIETALFSYSMHNISVNVDAQGLVVITGDVDALYDKLDIYEIVSKISGVTEIKDMVHVVTPDLPDKMIEANVERAVKDNSVIMEPDKISVTVTNGLVLLRGTVSYPKEKLMAETVSSWQDGVRGIENEIQVLSPKQARTDENVAGIVNEIIENQFPLIFNRRSVQVNVNHGIVTLNGIVRSLWELTHLKQECLQVMGVKNVIEHLTVKPE